MQILSNITNKVLLMKKDHPNKHYLKKNNNNKQPCDFPAEQRAQGHQVIAIKENLRTNKNKEKTSSTHIIVNATSLVIEYSSLLIPKNRDHFL